MNRYDVLGYGTHLILDGFRADAARLADPALLEHVLRDLGALLDQGPAPAAVMVPVEGDVVPGYSVGAVHGEAHVCIHTFPTLNKLTMDAFSTHTLPVDAVTSVFRHRFGVGRYESQVHGRGRLLPGDPEALRCALAGDRQYARLRLRDLLSSAS